MSMSNTTKRVREIRRKTRRKFSSEEKIRIVLDGLRGESSIAELCRQEGINSKLYYRCSSEAVPEHGISDSWYDPSHDGEGFVIEQINSELALVYWFTYDDAGNQSWMFNVGSIEAGKIRIPDLLQTSGGRFGRSFDPDSVALDEWGELNIDLGCSSGTASYKTQAKGFSSGSQSLVRLTQLAGVSCSD